MVAGGGFGALGVVTERACTGEVAISVKTSSAQYGPEGAAAGLRAYPSDVFAVAVTFRLSGACRAASSFLFTGGSAKASGSQRLYLLRARQKAVTLVRRRLMAVASKNVPARHGPAAFGGGSSPRWDWFSQAAGLALWAS